MAITMSDAISSEEPSEGFHDVTNLCHNSGALSRRKRNTPAKPTKKMATMRRLQDHDVRAIFECLHNKKAPPPNLHFRIVAVGPTGQKLSPPSYEFEDGLYVLLKPQRKKDRTPDYTKVPPHLRGYIMKHPMRETCPWSLSGPQFPRPTAIQQRYCYPKGNVEYASRKGGALWTMYGADGKEDHEFRLLHVYYSTKRAQNKGACVEAVSDDSYSPPKAKKAKVKVQRSSSRTTKKNRTPRTTRSSKLRVARLPISSPAITASTSGGSCPSPRSVDTLPPPNVHFSPPTHLNIATATGPNARSQQIFNSMSMPPLNHKHNMITFDSNDCDDAFDERRIHPVNSHEMATPYGDIFAGPPTMSSHYAFGNFSGMPYSTDGRMPALQHELGGGGGGNKKGTSNKQQQQQLGGGGGHPLYPHQQLSSHPPMYMHYSDHDLHNMVINDPVCTFPPKHPGMDDFFASMTPPDNVAVENFATHLETLHKRLQEMIQAAPSGDQAAMVSTLTSWAQHVVKEPLGNVKDSSDKKPAAGVKMEED